MMMNAAQKHFRMSPVMLTSPRSLYSITFGHLSKIFDKLADEQSLHNVIQL